MTELIQFLLNEAKKHGFAFVLLLGIVWYFHGQSTKLEEKVDTCNAATIAMYQQQNAILINAVERNSKAMEDLAAYLKTLNDAKHR